MTMRLFQQISSVTVLLAVLFTGAVGGVVGGAIAVEQDEALAAAQSAPDKRAARGARAGVEEVRVVKGVRASQFLAAHAAGSVAANCPAGKVAIGGTAYWTSSRAAVQFFLEPSLSGGTAYTDGIAADDQLNVQLICVAAG